MIRYPGSKDKIVRQITKRFPDALSVGPVFAAGPIEYREPFFGGGAVGFRVLDSLSADHAVWLNDKDYGIACLWNAVLADPHGLTKRIRSFTPSVEAFYKFKTEDSRRDLDYVETGFRKLALHQMSFSGLGAKAGGPIGGREQSSAYNVNCRWNASRLCRNTMSRHQKLRRFKRIQITSRDFSQLIDGAGARVFVYADPPYVDKGGQLYKHAMDESEHRRLAQSLSCTKAQWVLSYDDHALVRGLYSWASIESVSLTYTTAVSSTRRRKNSEVIITPKRQDRREGV